MSAKVEKQTDDKKKLTARQEQIQQALGAGTASGAKDIQKPPQIIRRQVLKKIKEVVQKGS